MKSDLKKSLKEMTLEELWELFPIELVGYRQEWEDQAREEIRMLTELIGDFNPRFHHIGSTAIPGIMAKPIVDILVEIPASEDWDRVAEEMEASGYILMNRTRETQAPHTGDKAARTPASGNEAPGEAHSRPKASRALDSEKRERMSFNKGYTPEGYAENVFHIHVHEPGDNDEVIFRDYLRAHPDRAREYEKLKLSLLPRYRNDRDGYTAAKTDFVRNILAEAGKIRMSISSVGSSPCPNR